MTHAQYDCDLIAKDKDELIAQQAAVIECQKRDFDEVLEALGLLSFYCDGITRTDAPPRDIYNQTFKIYRKHKDAPIALQPCPEVLNKVRADVVREFVAKFGRYVHGDGEFWLHELEDYVATFEQGEV